MAVIGIVPRRCVNLPPGSLGTIVISSLTGTLQEGPALEDFAKRFEEYLGVFRDRFRVEIRVHMKDSAGPKQARDLRFSGRDAAHESDD